MSMDEEVISEDSSNILNEDSDTIYIATDKDLNTVSAVQDPDGNIRTFFTPGKATNEEDAIERQKMFTKLEEFLNPNNNAVKKLIEHRVLKNPTVLSELLSVKFSDLVKVFHNLMQSKSTSMETAYLHLLQIVEDEGAEGIAQLSAEIDDLQGRHDGEFIEAVSSSEDGAFTEYKMNDELPSLRLRGLKNVLSDEEISSILDKYLSTIGKNSESQQQLDLAEIRRQKVKAAAILDLLHDEVMEDVSDDDQNVPTSKDEL